jgi:prepilin-type N-terminal cleavage/methylation domain-containing protein
MLLQILASRRRKVGFTLIELLIVIAIILILISIALPNFIEAQIRARMTKSRAEVKSIQTAFEMYMQDFKVYPRSCIPLMAGSNAGRCQDNWGFPGITVRGHLTTPIKYMKAMPDDLFAVNYSVLGSTGSVPEGHPYVKYRSTRRLVWNASWPDETPKSIIPKNKQAACWTQQFDLINPNLFKSKQYFISGLGPDHDEDVLPYYAPGLAGYKVGDEIFSPTNGTTSSGDIILLGP